MSLDIIFKKEFNSFGAIPLWYVGTKFFVNFPIEWVDYVRADGDELEEIRHRFLNLPSTLEGSCEWRGDFAKFIIANLK